MTMLASSTLSCRSPSQRLLGEVASEGHTHTHIQICIHIHTVHQHTVHHTHCISYTLYIIHTVYHTHCISCTHTHTYTYTRTNTHTQRHLCVVHKTTHLCIYSIVLTLLELIVLRALSFIVRYLSPIASHTSVTPTPVPMTSYWCSVSCARHLT